MYSESLFRKIRPFVAIFIVLIRRFNCSNFRSHLLPNTFGIPIDMIRAQQMSRLEIYYRREFTIIRVIRYSRHIAISLTKIRRSHREGSSSWSLPKL